MIEKNNKVFFLIYASYEAGVSVWSTRIKSDRQVIVVGYAYLV
jgi:hypothetical protein